MGIDPAGNVGGGMAQVLTDGVQIFSCQDQQGGVCMSKSMNGNTVQLWMMTHKTPELGV